MNSTFDPFKQKFTLQRSDGTMLNTSLVLADHNMGYMLRLSINYGTQLGASIVLLLILLLLTRSEKRLSSVFLLNAAALVSNIVRLACQISYFSSGFAKTYTLLAHDFSRVAQATYASQVMASVFFTLVLVCVETSLVLQIQVVCSNLRRRYRHLLLGASIAVALIPIGFRLAFMVENCIVIMRSGNMKNYHWLESATNVVATVSICFFCAIFVVKLGFAIKMRRRLGVKDFGPMKAIFIMGCQTMIIPALFSICQYWVNIPEFSHNLLTIVTISLPLSSIWAGFALDSSNNTANSTASRRNLWNVLSSDGTIQEKPNLSACSAATSPNTTCYSDPYPGKTPPQNPETGFAISVEHDISIHSYRRDAHSEV